MARSIVCLLLPAAIILAVAVTPAAATFPGRNGDIALLRESGYKASSYGGSVARFGSRGGAVRPFWACDSSGWDTLACWGIEGLAASPDGTRLAVLSMDRTTPAWDSGYSPVIHVLALDGSPELRVPLRLSGSESFEHLRWTADGAHVIVERRTHPASGPALPAGLVQVALDGGRMTELTTVAARDPDVAASGTLAFILDGQLHVQPLGGASRPLTRRGAANPSFSPDGRWIAFSRGCDRWGPARGCGVFVMRAAGGHAWKVARDGIEPVWSPDGRRIAYLRSLSWYDGYGSFVAFSIGLKPRGSGMRVSKPRQLTGRSRALDLSYGPAELEWLPSR